MLYTSYFAKLKTIPKDITRIVITRFPPKWLPIDKIDNMYLIKEFSPYQETLLDYKNTGNWDKYVIRFKDQMNTDIKMQELLNKMLKSLQNGKEYVLLCYEKDYEHCHRSLLAEWFRDKGIECKEI